MKKKKIIHLISILILVLAVFFILVYPVIKIAMSSSYNSNIVSRDITQEVLKIQNSLDSIELPNDNETAIIIKTAVDNSINTWLEFQELVNSRKIKMFLVKNKVYMANYEDTLNNANYHIIFYSQKGELKQCTKRVYDPEKKDNKIIAGYRLYFYNDYNIERYEDSNNTVHFYPSGEIESIRYTIGQEDTIRYTIKWSQDGKIIRQSSYDESKSQLYKATEEAKHKLEILE